MFSRVRLELARCHEYPEGSSDHGYELQLPLTSTGHLDRDGWLKHRKDAGFSRFWGGETERGHVKHDRHGWSLAFEPQDGEAEAIVRGDEHRFAIGEYVSIKERDGETRTFRVAVVS